MTIASAVTLPMGSRGISGRRFIALMMLLAWLGWTLACPQAMVGVEGFVAGTAGEVTQTFTSSHSHAGADGDICCAALLHISLIVQAHAFNVANAVSLFYTLLPLNIGDVTAVFMSTSLEYGSVQSRALIPRHSPALSALWPHAPPR